MDCRGGVYWKLRYPDMGRKIYLLVQVAHEVLTASTSVGRHSRRGAERSYERIMFCNLTQIRSNGFLVSHDRCGRTAF